MPELDLSKQLDLLQRLVLQERSVDLIELGPFMNLVYTDDRWYTNFPDIYKNKSIYDLAKHQKPAADPVGDIDAFIAEFDIRDEPFRFVLAHYAKTFPNFTVCDIGAQYGTSAMSTCLYLRSLTSNAKVLAFEPGIASKLTPLNFINNRFPEITFVPAAVGPVDGYVVLHRELGESENNRIVNPARDSKRGSISLPVKCVRLDTVLKEQGAFGPTVAKIDTQGGEPGVILGMSELLREHPITMLIEYTPGAIRNVVDPVSFIADLLQTHYCFDTGPGPRLLEITAANLAEHHKAVAGSKSGWVDLLLVPKTLPDADLVCDRIRSVQHGEPPERSDERLVEKPGSPAPAGAPAALAGRQPLRSRLQELTNQGRYREAVELLTAVDLAAERDPGVLYHAGVCLGTVGPPERGIELLIRAANEGFDAPWCAYHLGLFEAKRGRAASAAYYYAAGLLLDPRRDYIHPLLTKVAPGIGLEAFQAAQGRARSAAGARAVFDLGEAAQAAGRPGTAAAYFTAALVLDPALAEARVRLSDLAPGIALTILRRALDPAGT